MAGATVEILGDTEVRICCYSAFSQECERRRFLDLVFAIPAVRSVEIDPIDGVAILRRHRQSDSLLNVLRMLSEKLSSDTPQLATSSGGNEYLLIPRRIAPYGYVRPPQEIRGIAKPIYRGLGVFFVGMSIVGVLSPFIPTSPFVLLSSYFLIRSSRSLHHRLMQNRIFGPILDDFYVQEGIRWQLKRNTLIFMGSGFIAFTTLSGFAPGGVLIMASASLISLTLILSLPTVKGTHQQFKLAA